MKIIRSFSPRAGNPNSSLRAIAGILTAASLAAAVNCAQASPQNSIGVHWPGGGGEATLTDNTGAFGTPFANWFAAPGASGSQVISPASGGSITVTWTTGGGGYGAGNRTFTGYTTGDNQVVNGDLYAEQCDTSGLGPISVSVSGMSSLTSSSYTLVVYGSIDHVNDNSPGLRPVIVNGGTPLNFGAQMPSTDGMAETAVTSGLSLSGNSFSFTITDDSPTNTCLGSDDLRAVLSAMTLTYTPVPAPVFTLQPQSQTVANNGNVTFTASATTGNPPLSYQWVFDDTNIISGATASSYTLTGANSGNIGTYRAKATDNSGFSSFSLDADLTVAPGGTVLVFDPSQAFSGTYSTSTYGGGVGLFFNVLPGASVSVNQMGATLVEASGLSSSCEIQLFNANSDTVLSTVVFSTTDSAVTNYPVGVNLWLKPLTNSVTLAPGYYAVVKYGAGTYVNFLPNGLFNNSGGALSFGASEYATAGLGSLPSNDDAATPKYWGPTLVVTDVVASNRPTIAIQNLGGKAVLTWAGGGTLQKSTAVTGTYNNVVGATSPYTNSITGTTAFFRINQ